MKLHRTVVDLTEEQIEKLERERQAMATPTRPRPKRADVIRELLARPLHPEASTRPSAPPGA